MLKSFDTIIHSPADRQLSSKVLASIANNGYAIVQDFVQSTTVSEIFSQTPLSLPSINSNFLRPSIHGDSQFFTNVIAKSKIVYDIITSSFVIDLCTSYLGADFQLTNNRIQTTRSRIAMPWHTDNNRLEEGILVGRHDLPGLQFVLYLTDVGNSPFQLVKGSESWSLTFPNQYLLDSDILSKGLETADIYPSPGTLLILNTHVFHRAAPLNDNAYTRSILLFQVDAFSSKYLGHGEKLLVQPEFFNEITPGISKLLGFGRNRFYPAFPETSILTLNLRQLFKLQFAIFEAFPKIFFRKLLKRVLPFSFITSFKNRLVFGRSSSKPPQNNISSPYLER